MLALASQRREYSPSTPTHLRRTFSPILTSFSWSWDGVVIDPQDFGAVSQRIPLKNFLMTWKAFETDVLKLSGDSRFQDILKVLAIGLEYSQNSSRSVSLVSSYEPSLSVFDYQRLCNILAGYKFAELLVLRENIGSRVLPSAVVSNIYLPPSTNSRNTPHAFERLRDWPSILSGFRTAVNKSAPISPNTEIPDGSSRLLILMRLLVRNELKSHYLSIENNFLYAALHVYAFNMGIFPQGIIPNLPGEQKNIQIQFADEVSQQEYTEVTTTLLKQYDIGQSGASAGHASLCAPLHLALFISPLYLLFPFRIVKQSFHRRSIIEVSHKLGPHKPSIVLNIETLIWDAVFAIAERPLDIKMIIAQLALQVSAYDIDSVSCSPGEISWFSLSDDLSRAVHDKDDIQSEAKNVAIPHATSLSPPSGAGSPYSPALQPTTTQTTEDPIPTDTGANINNSCNATCPSAPSAVSPTPCSLITSPQASDAEERQSLSTRAVDDASNTDSADPRHVSTSKFSSSVGLQDSTATTQGETGHLHQEKHAGVVLDTSHTLVGSLTASIHLIHDSVDPSTITLYYNNTDYLTLDSFYDINMFDLDVTEADQPPSPTGSHERKIVESESQSDDTEGPAGSRNRKINDVESELSGTYHLYDKL